MNYKKMRSPTDTQVKAKTVKLFKNHLSYSQKYKKRSLENIMKVFNLIRQIVFRIKTGGVTLTKNQNKEDLEIYDVIIPAIPTNQKRKTIKNSPVLQKCEGARGTLYMKQVKNQPFYPQSAVKKTKILEIKGASMKIRTYENIINHHLIYIENVLGFLKVVD